LIYCRVGKACVPIFLILVEVMGTLRFAHIWTPRLLQAKFSIF